MHDARVVLSVMVMLNEDEEAVPHTLSQFDLVTHDLKNTRGVPRNQFVNQFGYGFHEPIPINLLIPETMCQTFRTMV